MEVQFISWFCAASRLERCRAPYSAGVTHLNGPLRDDFKDLYDALAANGTEANPQGVEMRGMAIDAYLKRHFDYGATLVVMNVGPTSDAMMRLHDAVWGHEALDAYRTF